VRGIIERHNAFPADPVQWRGGWDDGRDALYDQAGRGPEDMDWSKPIANGPLAHGFDYYFGDDVPNFPPYTWIENDRILIEPTVSFTPIPEPTENDEAGQRMAGHDSREGAMVDGWCLDAVMPRLTERTVEWIGEQKDSEQPFFLYWSWTAPHTPVVPIKEFRGSTRAGPYGDYMHQSDAHLGQVLSALDENGFTENTLVIFTSDNGPESIAYERIKNHGHYSMGDLRGLKRDLWEGGHRVPFIVRWPERIEPGQVNDDLISQIDIMPTIAEIIGYDLPDTAAEDGYNLLPVWIDGSPGPRRTLVYNTFNSAYALRHDNWVYIDAESGGHTKVPDWFDELHGYSQNEHPGALYDLSTDINQKHNLYEEHPDIVDILQKILHKIRQ